MERRGGPSPPSWMAADVWAAGLSELSRLLAGEGGAPSRDASRCPALTGVVAQRLRLKDRDLASRVLWQLIVEACETERSFEPMPGYKPILACYFLLGLGAADFYPVNRSQPWDVIGNRSLSDLPHNFGTGYDPGKAGHRQALALAVATPPGASWTDRTNFAGSNRRGIRTLAPSLLSGTCTLLENADLCTSLIVVARERVQTNDTAAGLGSVSGSISDGADLPRRADSMSRRAWSRIRPFFNSTKRESAWLTALATMAACAIYFAMPVQKPASASDDGSVDGTPTESAPAEKLLTTPVVGELSALNRTTKSGHTEWPDVVINDRLQLRLTLANPSSQPVIGVAVELAGDLEDDREDDFIAETITAKMLTSDTDYEFSIPVDEKPPESTDDGTTYHSAEVLLGVPDNTWDHCSLGGKFVPDEQATVRRQDEPNTWLGIQSWDLPPTNSGDQDSEILGRYWIGDIEPHDRITLTLSGTFGVDGASTPGLEGGSALRFAVGDRDWANLDSASTGDVVTALLRVHDTSCSTTESPVPVVLRSHFRARGYLVLEGWAGRGEDRVALGRAELNIVGGRRALLVPIPGTTKLYGNRSGHAEGREGCADRPEVLDRLPDGLSQAGVAISVAGYLPREPCDTHSRWVSSDFRVVAR